MSGFSQRDRTILASTIAGRKDLRRRAGFRARSEHASRSLSRSRPPIESLAKNRSSGFAHLTKLRFAGGIGHAEVIIKRAAVSYRAIELATRQFYASSRVKSNHWSRRVSFTHASMASRSSRSLPSKKWSAPSITTSFFGCGTEAINASSFARGPNWSRAPLTNSLGFVHSRRKSNVYTRGSSVSAATGATGTPTPISARTRSSDWRLAIQLPLRKRIPQRSMEGETRDRASLARCGRRRLRPRRDHVLPDSVRFRES